MCPKYVVLKIILSCVCASTVIRAWFSPQIEKDLNHWRNWGYGGKIVAWVNSGCSWHHLPLLVALAANPNTEGEPLEGISTLPLTKSSCSPQDMDTAQSVAPKLFFQLKTQCKNNFFLFLPKTPTFLCYFII